MYKYAISLWVVCAKLINPIVDTHIVQTPKNTHTHIYMCAISTIISFASILFFQWHIMFVIPKTIVWINNVGNKHTCKLYHCTCLSYISRNPIYESSNLFIRCLLKMFKSIHAHINVWNMHLFFIIYYNIFLFCSRVSIEKLKLNIPSDLN